MPQKFEMYECDMQDWNVAEGPQNADCQEDSDAQANEESQPAYKISPSNAYGSSTSSLYGSMDSELYFAIDWDPDAASQYDVAFLEEPQLHSSTEEARSRRDQGPKPHTLQECLAVCRCFDINNTHNDTQRKERHY